MKIGYCRVSSEVQCLDLQIDALKNAGCEKVFTDKLSGTKKERPGLTDAIDFANPGDILVVWRLDRLGRSLRDLIDTVSALEARGISFKSLHESLDTSTSGGKLIFHIFGALSEFERSLISERTHAGLIAARKRGRLGGRPKSLNGEKTLLAKKLHSEGQYSIGEICRIFGICRTTLYSTLKRA